MWKSFSNQQLALLPLMLPLYLVINMLGNPISILQGWMTKSFRDAESPPPVGSQLLAYVLVGLLGYVITDALIPNIQQYTLKKGICGKDLGKRGTAMADKDM
jgi:hypothetical protein